MIFRRWKALCILVLASLAYGYSIDLLDRKPRALPQEHLSVVFPLPAQLWLALGDRYLAANINVFRAIMVRIENLPAQAHATLAQIQRDAAVLNPAHEDNYYSAAAVLPWQGSVEAAQFILQGAIDARPGDSLPAFFHAFNNFYFHKDYKAASLTLKQAAAQAKSEDERLSFEVLAARWAEKSADDEFAIAFARNLAKESKNAQFQAYLKKRVQRLEAVAQVKAAMSAYKSRNGALPKRLEDLTDSGLLTHLPVDPFGRTLALGPEGQVLFVRPEANKPQEVKEKE